MQKGRKEVSQSTSRKAKPAKLDKSAKGGGMMECVRAELGLIAGIVSTMIFFTIGEPWVANLDSLPNLIVLFAWLFGVMVWCAFGVVRHADALAEILGEPYGTLILTTAVISIEVTILATVMLGGNPNPTLPRETMFAILMIVLNGMVGTVLAIGGLRYVEQEYNLQGAMAYLAAITPLAVIALVVPTYHDSDNGPDLHAKTGCRLRVAHCAPLWSLSRYPDDAASEVLHPTKEQRVEECSARGACKC